MRRFPNVVPQRKIEPNSVAVRPHRPAGQRRMIIGAFVAEAADARNRGHALPIAGEIAGCCAKVPARSAAPRIAAGRLRRGDRGFAKDCRSNQEKQKD